MEVQIDKKTVGEIVAADYRAAGVFEKHGIDFCCGGQIPLRAACAEKGVDAEEVLQELEQVAQSAGDPSERYDQWELDFLADYIVNQHHAYTKSMIPRLKEFAATVADVHGDSHPETRTVAQLWDELSGEFIMHMQKEELMLFPYIKRLVRSKADGELPAKPRFGSAHDLIQDMEADHESAGDHLAQIEALSQGFTPPQDVCNTYRALYAYLAEFDASTKKHVHLENNILFPKAIRLETHMRKPDVETKTIDVRTIPPPQRHPLIFQMFDALEPEQSFLLLNDHDPKPLYYQFRFERESQFTWEYLEDGPAVWRVRIGRSLS
ncbi:MAG: iron-sulfur cluster repair di-iron protein [Caldilineaceae bacterium]|nr:iron-sulfur cluster repair di-iron protein [Caldilineaceae bacterium]HRJ41743.1 iron-sulfur cluster repair di-iron protein [Caldilineaceae bacterium]